MRAERLCLSGLMFFGQSGVLYSQRSLLASPAFAASLAKVFDPEAQTRGALEVKKATAGKPRNVMIAFDVLSLY